MTGIRSVSIRIERLLLAAAVCAVAGLALGGVAAASPGRGDGVGRHGAALFVSSSGGTGASDRSCATAGYSTIQSAVDAAPSGGTVIVCPGTYTEHVVVSSPLTLRGIDATISATPTTSSGQCEQLVNGHFSLDPCLAGVTIRSGSVTMSGFTVTGAIGEGIFVSGSVEKGPISNVVIRHNRVIGNDTGGIPPHTNAALYPQCVGNPSDCGEGIHLQGVADSRVTGNYIRGNTGGVLLTDEFGATHGNLIDRNIITGNLYDCGVTVTGHNPGALDAQGNPQPTVTGVYDNVIRGNWITDNGVNGVGAGVLFAAPFAGTAAYDNLAVGNYIAGNGLSGVTMHAHTTAPGTFEDINGNRVVANVIGRNNVNGDALDSAVVPGSATDPSTTGILVFSGTVPVSTTIARNTVFDDRYGIWLGVGGNVTATLDHNRFHGVGTPVFTQP